MQRYKRYTLKQVEKVMNDKYNLSDNLFHSFTQENHFIQIFPEAEVRGLEDHLYDQVLVHVDSILT